MTFQPMAWIRRNDAKGLLTNIGLAVGLAVSVTGLILALGWDAPAPKNAPATYDPPGWFVGIVWTILFALMGTAHWLLAKSADEKAAKASRLVVLLIAFCWVYPFYTLAPGSIVAGFVGNIATVLLAVWVIVKIRRRSLRAAAFVSPVVVWVSFATYLTARMLSLIG